jgi:hypothetical protein
MLIFWFLHALAPVTVGADAVDAIERVNDLFGLL